MTPDELKQIEDVARAATGEDQQVAVNPFSQLIPKSVWLDLSNVCDKGKFKVTLTVNGIERELFNSYVHQDDGVICEGHNLTWLLANLKAQLATAREDALRDVEHLVECAEDWLHDTEEECGHNPGWQALSGAIRDYRIDPKPGAKESKE